MTPREALIEILAEEAGENAPGLAECLIQDLAERGVVLVPVEPTEDMKLVGRTCEPFITAPDRKWTPGQIVAVRVWRAMVAAARS